MANPFFDQRVTYEDADLFEDLTTEFIYNNGIAVSYIERDILQIDPVLNEPVATNLGEAHVIDMFITQSESFVPDNFLISKFGMTWGAGSNVVLAVSKKEFKRLIGEVPREGDVIYIEHVQEFLEITNVNTRDPYISGGHMFMYEIYTQPYQHSGEFMPDDILADAPSMEGIFEDFSAKVNQTEYANDMFNSSSTLFNASYDAELLDIADFRKMNASSTGTGVLTDINASNVSVVNVSTTSYNASLVTDLTSLLDHGSDAEFALMGEMHDRIGEQADNQEIVCNGEKFLSKSKDPFGFL